MADARQAPAITAKNAAMRALLRTAGWQWAAGCWRVPAAAVGPPNFVAHGVALALVAWAAAAWVGRVPWPFGRRTRSARARRPWSRRRRRSCCGCSLGAGSRLCCRLGRARWRAGPQRATPCGYPGLVFLTGIGWLLLLDLSANGPPSNRYLALYHHGHLWLGMLTLTLVAFVRQPLGRALTLALSLRARLPRASAAGSAASGARCCSRPRCSLSAASACC